MGIVPKSGSGLEWVSEWERGVGFLLKHLTSFPQYFLSSVFVTT
jgi:hypothetical protein